MLRTVRINASDGSESQRATPADLAVAIRDYLLALPLKGGERIFEAQIARETSVSRQLVREACQILEDDGLLVYAQNKGYALRVLTREEVRRLVEFRLILEEAACVSVASMGDRTTVIAELVQAYASINALRETSDPALQISADLAFHRVIVEHMGNPWILQSFDRMGTQFRYAIRLMSRSLNDFKIYGSSHEALIACMEKGDAELARKAIRTHISMFLPTLLKRVEE